MTVGRLCSRVVATASPQETVRAAAQRMAVNEVGTLVILDATDGARPVGILTDRDVAVRCVAADRDPDQTKVIAIMSRPVHFVEEAVAIEEAVAEMARVGTRRLVVRDGERLVGILSLDDVLDLWSTEVGAIGRLLKKQEPHVPA